MIALVAVIRKRNCLLSHNTMLSSMRRHAPADSIRADCLCAPSNLLPVSYPLNISAVKRMINAPPAQCRKRLFKGEKTCCCVCNSNRLQASLCTMRTLRHLSRLCQSGELSLHRGSSFLYEKEPSEKGRPRGRKACAFTAQEAGSAGRAGCASSRTRTIPPPRRRAA